MIARGIILFTAIGSMGWIAHASTDGHSDQTPVLKVRPSARTIIVDGRCQASEWLGIAEKGRIRAFRNGDDVFMCIAMPDGGLGSLDILLGRADGTILNLHSSAQIADRVLQPGSEAPPFEWGSFDGWYAPPFSFSGLTRDDASNIGVSFRDADSREVVLARRLIQGSCAPIQIRLEALGKSRRGSWQWPDEGWARLCT